MKSIYKLFVLAGVSFVATSCFNKSKPNYELFPNMYRSVAYETYSEVPAFKNGKEGQLPAEGSIKRGYTPYDLPNTTEGLMLSHNTKSPFETLTEKQAAEGAQLYGIYCAVCHGAKGDGQGVLVKREKFLGVPSYADRDITAGSVFFVETYGLNSMGSHANQLSQTERWLVADHVMKLKGELTK
ncbi:cytochrome c [Flavobacterium agricola]|uniref:Cytochrome c n=1 Tax=Flavobacterium agricola TaxID=2870839 RepID=A0ABY6M260_9FLAO|nr:cytochrome c [Flavobacterium agricola]UYW02636.1 cytochrome c [Flavobacterium agricola]